MEIFPSKLWLSRQFTIAGVERKIMKGISSLWVITRRRGVTEKIPMHLIHVWVSHSAIYDVKHHRSPSDFTFVVSKATLKDNFHPHRQSQELSGEILLNGSVELLLSAILFPASLRRSQRQWARWFYNGEWKN